MESAWRGWPGSKFWRGWCGSIKLLDRSKSWRGSNTISIFFTLRFFSLCSKCSLHVFGPCIRLFVFPMLISYWNWRWPNYFQTSIPPNIILWIKWKRLFNDRFPFLIPEAYLESTQTSVMEQFYQESYIFEVSLRSKYTSDFHNNNKISLIV